MPIDLMESYRNGCFRKVDELISFVEKNYSETNRYMLYRWQLGDTPECFTKHSKYYTQFRNFLEKRYAGDHINDDLDVAKFWAYLSLFTHTRAGFKGFNNPEIVEVTNFFSGSIFPIQGPIFTAKAVVNFLSAIVPGGLRDGVFNSELDIVKFAEYECFSCILEDIKRCVRFAPRANSISDSVHRHSLNSYAHMTRLHSFVNVSWVMEGYHDIKLSRDRIIKYLNDVELRYYINLYLRECTENSSSTQDVLYRNICLIYDWLGTSKMEYSALSKRYNLSVNKVEDICDDFTVWLSKTICSEIENRPYY